MAGRGRVPKPQEQRRHSHAPTRGEWRAAPGIGWQHGPIPAPPDGLLDSSRDAWTAWMTAWWAAHWLPGDLPMLEIVILVFDQISRGTGGATLRGELRQLLDNYGISPKGRQDRRWVAPDAAKSGTAAPADPANPYTHLRVVSRSERPSA